MIYRFKLLLSIKKNKKINLWVQFIFLIWQLDNDEKRSDYVYKPKLQIKNIIKERLIN